MSRELGLHSQPSTYRPHVSHGAEWQRFAGPPPVLIEVPAVSARTRAPRRPSEAATERIRGWAVSGTPRRRRRLKREVRTAGLALVTAASLMTAGLLLRGDRASANAAHADAFRPPSISLSVEPAALTSPAAPVVLPGYLLPADANEEPSHAGG